MLDVLQPLIKQFMPFAQERMGFDRPPRLFLRNDTSNASNPLGKTAYYDPGKKSITLYVTGRHPKDIMRSLSHELVHHSQNCRGEFDNAGEMGEGYAQNDEHLREMEREAYETGNLCFRDWEDSMKSTIYFESLQRDKGVNRNMSTKDWKNKEITKLLSEAWGFDFDLKKLNEGDTGASKGDESKTHPGEEDYTWKKGEDSKTDKDTHDDGSRKYDDSDTGRGKDYVNEDSGEEEGRHYDDNRMSDDDHIKAIEHHLDALRKDRDYDDDHIDEMSTPDSPDRVGGRDAGGRRVRPLEEDEIEEVAGVAPRASDRRSPHKRTPVPEDDAEKSEEEEKQVAEDVFDSIRAELREALIKALNQKRSQ